MSLKQPLIIYLQTSNISRTLAGNIIVDYSDVDRLSALLELLLHSQLNPWFQLSGQRQLQDETRIILVLGFGASNIRDFTVTIMHADNTMYSGTRNPLRNTCRIDYYEVLSIIEILIKFLTILFTQCDCPLETQHLYVSMGIDYICIFHNILIASQHVVRNRSISCVQICTKCDERHFIPLSFFYSLACLLRPELNLNRVCCHIQLDAHTSLPLLT